MLLIHSNRFMPQINHEYFMGSVRINSMEKSHCSIAHSLICWSTIFNKIVPTLSMQLRSKYWQEGYLYIVKLGIYNIRDFILWTIQSIFCSLIIFEEPSCQEDLRPKYRLTVFYTLRIILGGRQSRIYRVVYGTNKIYFELKIDVVSN